MSINRPTKEEFFELAQKGNLIPVYRQIVADMETPVSTFLKVRKGKYSYLLESVEGGERIARYSFLGCEPSLIFKSNKKTIEIIKGNKKKTFRTKDDPISEIKKIMSQYKFVSIEGLPRFCGGLVGYMGYDMVRFFEDIPDDNPDKLHLPDSVFMLTDTILIFDHIDHLIKIVCNVHVKEGTTKKKLSKIYDNAMKRLDIITKRLNRRLEHEKTRRRKNVTKFKSN